MIIDFGFAEYAGKSKKLLLCCGSPGYMAPEIFFSKIYDTKVDIFSCGVILYNLLTGKP